MDLLPKLLIGLLILPAIGAVVVALLGANRIAAIRWISLSVVLVNLLLSAVLAVGFVAARPQLAESSAPNKSGKATIKTFSPAFVPGASNENPSKTSWRMIDFGKAGAVEFYLGIDGLNVWLVLLTSLLMVSGVLISWNSITERANEYYAWLLLLGTGMAGVFLAFDLILFYIFFELTLVPLFFLIGIWGGPQRRYAARKFFIYTLAGSVITLLGLLAIVVVCHDFDKTSPLDDTLTFSIPELVTRINTYLEKSELNQEFLATFQIWVFLALVAGFAIKVPLAPFHTWLPLAHVEAPTAGSVLLAGVLLKIGSYGFLRLCVPLTPDACLSVGLPLIGTLAVVGIIYGAFCALAQDDIKRLVAYSSVSHMGFCMLGMFALNVTGLTGSLLQMINHGLSTGALFLLVGMLYDRYHTRKIADYGGMGAKLGIMTFCWVFICLSSIGLPGLNGFVGEALCFFGMFQVEGNALARVLAVAGTAGIILGAWYLLSMVRRVFFGTPKEPEHHGASIKDMNLREWAALGPIMVLCLLLGVCPQPVIKTSRPDIEVISKIMDLSRNRQKALASGNEREPRTTVTVTGAKRKIDSE